MKWICFTRAWAVYCFSWLLLSGIAGIAQPISISSAAFTNTVDFGVLGTGDIDPWTNGTSVPGVYLMTYKSPDNVDISNHVPRRVIASSGNHTGTRAYNLGLSGDSDRALGWKLSSGSMDASTGFLFRNNSGVTNLTLAFDFVFEEWRDSSTVPQKMTVQYLVDSSGDSSVLTNDAAWKTVGVTWSPLNQNSGVLNGNTHPFSLSGAFEADVLNGAYIWFRVLQRRYSSTHHLGTDRFELRVSEDPLSLSDRLKSKVFEWTLAKADAEGGTLADELQADVAAIMNDDVGIPSAVSTNIVPTVRETQDNPFWELFSNQLATDAPFLTRTYPDDWAVCSPQSSRYMDANLMISLIDHLDTTLSVDPLNYSDINILIFDIAQSFDSFDMLTRTWPGLFVPSLQEHWLERLELFMARIYEVRGNPTLNDRIHGLNYPNPDAAALLAVGIANEYFDMSEWRTYEANLLDGLEAHQYADGAWSYLFESNEEPAYHGVVLKSLLRYWERTKSARVYAMIEKSAPYYPLSVEAGGVIEGSTSPYWKQRWDAVLPRYPGAVGGITGDPQNLQLANELMAFNENAGLDYGVYDMDILRMAACWYRTDVPSVELDDNHIKYDRNIEGPRGRFGDWSFCATGRDMDRDRGKYTFVGSMVTDDSLGVYPLSGALQVAMNRMFYNSTNSYVLGMNDENSMVTDSRVAVFCTKYNLQLPIPSGGYSQPQPWIGKQQWIMTPERVIGFAQIEPDGNQVAYGLEGLIRLGCGRGLPFEGLPVSSLSDLGNGAYSYGKLRLHILDHNYAQVMVTNAPDDYRGESTDILLQDAVRAAGGSQTYADGTKQWYVIEARPEGSAPALDVQHWEKEGIYALYTQETSNRYVLVIHNTTSSSHAFALDQVADRIHVAQPFQYFLDDAEPVLSGTNSFAVNIPPMQQLTLIWGSELVSDLLDSDGDGVADVAQNLSLDLTASNGRLSLGFTTGTPDYSGQPVSYVIDFKSNLMDIAWQPFVSNILLNGQEFRTNPAMGFSAGFYRVRAELAK